MPETTRDYDAVARQLGRGPRPFRVAARCPFGQPSVIENERRREMPTSFWVTCPSLVAAISRLESTGGVRRHEKRRVGSRGNPRRAPFHLRDPRRRRPRRSPRQRQVPSCFHGLTSRAPSRIPSPNGPSSASTIPTRKAAAAVRRMRMTSCYTPDRIPGAWRNRQTHRT